MATHAGVGELGMRGCEGVEILRARGDDHPLRRALQPVLQLEEARREQRVEIGRVLAGRTRQLGFGRDRFGAYGDLRL